MSYQLHNFEAGDVLYASQLNEMDGELKFLDEEKVPKSSGLYYGKCTTSSFDSHIFTVTIPGVTSLEVGTAILVWFQWGQLYNGTPKLNVNGLGAKNIYWSSGEEAGLYEWGNGEILLLMYDGTNWVIADGNHANTAYYGVTKLENSATSTSMITALTPSSLNTLVQSMIAPYVVYSSNATYAVGDRVRYGFYVYQCNTAILTAEAWNAAHWTRLDSLIELIEAAAADAATKQPTIHQGTISLSTTWSGSGPYTQTVTVTGATVTSDSKIDLQPDATALAQLISDGVTALFVTNNNGTLTATAIGAATTVALTIQCTVTEVST